MTIYRDSQFTPVREPERARRGSRLIPLLSLACGLCWALSGCVTTTETTYEPDGTKASERTRKEADRSVLYFGGSLIQAYSPRAIDRSGK